MFSCAEYIWLDGAKPTSRLRSKSKIISIEGQASLSDFPDWGFDGSSTYQAPGEKSDLILKPVNFVDDPIRGPGNYLVMCEVFTMDGEPVASNTRALLRKQIEACSADLDPWIGFEQEYTFFQDGRPLGWPKTGYPEPQGPYYCGVGKGRVFGRQIVEEHMVSCMEAGLMLFGINAEVMPSQWEFQIGYRGESGETADPLTCSDHLWIGRWLLLRIAEDYDVVVSFDNKPLAGDWNGAGTHTNFSTKAMRDEKTGWNSIKSLISSLEARHHKHIENYGAGLEQRLTGIHETCDLKTFRAGANDRGASVRIPNNVAEMKCGYI
ncbi:MAG: glutamine synthetase beta-grasp domain-containing protein, partial [Myxococcales bacterium]|nr:glutamine synthetase beta-grasp domain-containing protein [Myxococcales bacterium]